MRILGTLLQDIRHSFRMFSQNRGFTIAAVAALALGIGANTAVFSVFNTVLLKPSAFPDAGRIVFLSRIAPEGPFQNAAPAHFAAWRRLQGSILDHVAGFRSGVVNLTSGDRPLQLKSAQVSTGFFAALGAKILTGRAFSEDEDLPNGPKAAMISESLWEDQFQRAPDIAGKTIQLAGEPYPIVGVVSRSFDFRDLGPNPDVWIPFQIPLNSPELGAYFRVVARLHDGVSFERANAVLKVTAEEFNRAFPSVNQNFSFGVVPLQDVVIGDVRPTLWILAVAVGMVLLIACSNVANLLLARALSRQREFAIRAAVGAGRGRLIAQVLAESILLSITGAVCGAALGYAGMRTLLAVNTADLPRVGDEGTLVALDWRVLGFTLLVSLATGIVFGLLPAVQASRADLAMALRESASRAGSTGASQGRTRSILVVAEVALAVILLTGAALLIRTSLALSEVRPGFDASHVLTMRTSLTAGNLRKTADVEQLIQNGVERIKSIPGIMEASAGCCVPLENGYGLAFRIEGRPLSNGPFHGFGHWLPVAPGYFDVFRIPLIRGRAFDRRDNGASPPVVIINQTMAKQYWPDGADPLRDQLLIGKGVMSQFDSEKPRQIIGIAQDIRDSALNKIPEPSMYIPQAQMTDAITVLHTQVATLAWVVRTQPGFHSAAVVQEQLRQATGLPVSDLRGMDEVVSRSVSRQRFNMILMSVFGFAALTLAAIGVYGLMAYSVQQRTREIGIRMALGAEVAEVQRMMIRQGMGLALAGVAVGITCAWALGQQLASSLYGVGPHDPVTFAVIAVALTLIALAAVWIPSRRAARIDPVDTLRTE